MSAAQHGAVTRSDATRSPALLTKGGRARAEIIDAALALAGQVGLDGLTINTVAARVGRSKSGVFAHFGSRDELQIAVLDAFEQRFVDSVLVPALTEPRGLPRLRRLIDLWIGRIVDEPLSVGLWFAAAGEFDDQPGPVRDRLVAMIEGWQSQMRVAIDQAAAEGHIRHGLGADDVLLLLEGMVLGVHVQARLLSRADMLPRAHRLIDVFLAERRTGRAPPAAAPAAAALSGASGPAS